LTTKPSWTEIRSRFELEPQSANLVTVVRGVTTRANRQLLAAEAEPTNAFRPSAVPTATWKQEVRKKAAGLIGADVGNVALLCKTTEGVTTALVNWPLKPGDEILTSSPSMVPSTTRSLLAQPETASRFAGSTTPLPPRRSARSSKRSTRR
jgi:hypothetical protein